MPKTPKPRKGQPRAAHNPDLRIYSINKKNLRNLSKSRVFRISVALIIVALVGYFFYHQHQINEKYKVQKAEFAQLETRMQKTMDQIVATVGRPYELHHGQGCGYTALKFARGPLSCANYYTFSFGVGSLGQGKSLTVNLIKALKLVYSDSSLTAAEPEKLWTGRPIGDTYYFQDKQGFGCYLRYDPETSKLHNETLDANFKKPVDSVYVTEYHFVCSGRPVKPIYTVEE